MRCKFSGLRPENCLVTRGALAEFIFNVSTLLSLRTLCQFPHYGYGRLLERFERLRKGSEGGGKEQEVSSEVVIPVNFG